MSEKIRVMVCGACGRMGQEVVCGVLRAENMQLVGAVDLKNAGVDIGMMASGDPVGVAVAEDLRSAIAKGRPQVMVDFTVPGIAMANARIALAEKVFPVIGTTGFTAEDLDELHRLCEQFGMGAVVAPNFAIGAVLMMRFAREAAKYLPHVEIIEMHHDGKIDAPSGTAMKTAEMIADELPASSTSHQAPVIKLAGVRGGEYRGVTIHSVRLPGLVAHQEVIFGGLGQVFTMRHDSISRESFIPGVLLAVEQVIRTRGVIYGLENLL